MRRVVDDDPLTLAIAPPPNETAEERLAREELEERARQVSKRIDAEIKLAKVAMKKKQKAVKVLVVGQSLSGKSTTIKNFQMTYAQRSWAEERESWKAELNNMQTTYMNEGTTSRVSVIGLGERHKSLTLKLAPLRQIERDLISLLGAGSYETQDAPKTPSRKEGRNVLHEFALRSTTGWKAVLDHVRNPTGGRDQQLQRVAGDVIASCKDDIQQLWGDVLVQQMLQKHNIRLEDAPGFFLDDVKRIATREYIPTDADVVRARLRTTGVQEYHFTLDRGALTALDWWMYDVAGIRTSRAAWVPYFKDITAMIFLAPLSAFNETLPEDPTTNSIHDTFLLWKTVCSNKLLANVQIILFMNKTDLLQKKLQSGILVRDHIPEYQERSNDFATVTTWFRRSFSRIYKECNPPTRKLVSHFTSVIDTQATAETLSTVKAAILRNDVIEAGLL